MSLHALRPFYFSLLSSPTSKTAHMKALNLISKLSSPLPLPNQATTADETTMEEIPEWVAKLAFDKGAAFAWKVMEKQIYASDVNEQQNRFMIKKQIAIDRIMPILTEEEIIVANLMNNDANDFLDSNRRRMNGGEGEKLERKQGREHDGLEVMVYNSDRWGFLLYLTRWDESKASVLKGGNYKEFLRRSYFNVGDHVGM